MLRPRYFRHLCFCAVPLPKAYRGVRGVVRLHRGTAACRLRCTAPGRPSQLRAQLRACFGMGLLNSKPESRMDELLILISSTQEVVERLVAARIRDAERAAAAPDCDQDSFVFDQAFFNAVWDHNRRLRAEFVAILDHRRAQDDGRSVLMPKPTPSFNLTPPPEPQTGAAPVLAVGPGTPMGSTNAWRGRSSSEERGRSSSSSEEQWRRSIISEEGPHAGSGEGSSETVHLLGTGSGRLPLGLRQRQGHGEGS